MSFFFSKKKLKELKELNPSWKSLKGLNFFLLKIWLKELNFFSQFDSKNCSNLSFSWFKYMDLLHMTQRIEPSYLRDSNTWTFLKIFDSKKWTFFFRTQSFSSIKNNSQNCFFFWIRPTELIFFCELNRLISWIWRKELKPFNFWIWRKELNLLIFEYDSKNWTFSIWHKEIELFCWMRLKELNLFSMWFKEFFHKNDSKHFTLFKKWLQELNLFWLNMTQRIESFFRYYSKNWTLFNIWLEELNIFSIELFQYDWKRLNFFNMFWRVEPFFWYDLKNGLFGKMSQIFEPFLNMTQRIEFLHMIPIIEPYFINWLTELNFLNILSIEFFFSKKKNPQRIERIEPFLDITQRIEFFCWIYESKNWTFFINLTQRTVPSFFFHDSNTWTFFTSKNWTFFFTWLKYLNFFENFWFKEMDPFFQDSKFFHQ